MELCIQYILAIQKRFCGEGKMIPLCIVTSIDEYAALVKFLQDNEKFGLGPGQITLLKEPTRMPAFIDRDAKLALSPIDPYKLIVKPHGSGDVHSLLHKNKVTERWHESGTKWFTVIAVSFMSHWTM